MNKIEGVQQRLYSAYQLDWMTQYGCSIKDLLDVLQEELEEQALDESPDSDMSGTMMGLFDAFESDRGFDGSLYVCFGEFLGAEYLDKAYMRELCDRIWNGDKLYELYLEDVNCQQAKSQACFNKRAIDNIVGRRFESLKQIEDALSKIFKKNVHCILSESENLPDCDFMIDYEIEGDGDVHTLFYLKGRGRCKYYITEV